ncbi:MAG: galactokinase [Flavobacteriaceae bacterium]|nr:galactokinase [Flavobacteriaceae bacterium]
MQVPTHSLKESIKVAAPGRICLFGDHQDYLGLPVIACAINRYIYLNARINNNKMLRIHMPDIKTERVIDLQKPLLPANSRDYFISAIKVLQDIGCTIDVGYDVQISGDIPINAGLSSSSALVVAWITFLLDAFGAGTKVTPELIARLAYRTEVLEYNEPGGLMDQYTISIGNLLFINTVDGSHKIINKELESLIVGESGIPKQTLGTLKNLRDVALQAISSVQAEVKDFKIENSTVDDYAKLKHHVPEDLQPVFYAAINNYAITKEAFQALNNAEIDLDKIGNLMTMHHDILKDVLKITVPLIDYMINAALSAGAYGAKIVGSGGGGSIAALSSKENEEKVIKAMLEAGAKSAYKVRIVGGVHVI